MGNSSISHEDGKRIVTVSSALYKNITATDVVSEFMKHKAEVLAGTKVQISTGGETEEMNKTFLEMLQALILGLLLMMIVLILEFNSFRYAFYTLSIAPLSLTGVLLGLTITRQAISFPSILGFIALAGVIVNHTILLIDSIDRTRRDHPERPIREIVIGSASTRLRPILLTTVTTVIGMLPLVFVNAMWGPLALTVMFGLSFSLLLTLLFIPIIVYRWPGKGGRG
jgi:HAE1 family hydrophobic/amphiphilic exporter-1